MALSFASNTASLHAQNQLAKTTQKLESVFEKLSSGLRINKASDDAAGLALADSLRTNARLASVAIRNANDGISINSLQDDALGVMGNILNRMSELANQSSNGVYTNAQRSALSSEFLALGSEIERIASVTTFNNITLLSATSSITLQVGFDNAASSQITMNAVLGTLNSLGLAGSGSSALSYSIISTSTTGSTTSALNALSAVNNAITSLNITRGTVGAIGSRLSQAVDYLQVVRENYVAADSKIRDVDVAQEVAAMVRLQILQQAGTAVLAQANLQPSVALSLLK